MFRCPHCLELVRMEEAGDGVSMRCPVCAGTLTATGQQVGRAPKYEVHGEEEKAHQSKEVQEYVDSLEKRARKDRKRKPYHRVRAPIALLTGLILIGGGVAFFLNALLGLWGFMSALINGILLSFV